MDENAPPDKYSLMYITFLIHGIATLLPWNMFITAITYFTDYKLSPQYIGYDFPFKGNFMQYMTLSSQIPNVLFNWFNIFVPLKGDLTLRIMWSMTVNIMLFVLTIALAMLDTSGWPYPFFYITMLTVVILNMATGVYQNTIFGMVATLPPNYTAIVILGNNICGIFTTLVSILSYYAAGSKQLAAIYYFITAIFMLMVGLDTYYALPLNRFYRYYDLKAKKQKEQQTVTEKLPYLVIVKKALPQMINVWGVFFVTLAVFPAMQASTGKSSNTFFIQDDFMYMQILCFLTFNVFAVIGNVLPFFVIWPPKEFLWIPVAIRFVFIPLFLFCNYQPFGLVRTLPVIISNDYIYWLLSSLMAITNGYLGSLSMMYTPSTVEGQYAPVAGMFAGASLISGVFSGIVISFLWPWLVSNIG